MNAARTLKTQPTPAKAKTSPAKSRAGSKAPTPASPPDNLRLSQTDAQVQLVPLTHLRLSPLNVRQQHDPAKLRELAASIYSATLFGPDGAVLHTGVVQNLVARPGPDGTFEVAAGGRRRAAALLLVAGLDLEVEVRDEAGHPVMRGKKPLTERRHVQVAADYPMPVSVRDLTDAQMLEVSAAENVQRDNLDALGEADAYAAQVAAGVGVQELALRNGVSSATVQARLRLARGLGPEARAALHAGKINLAHAQVIAGAAEGVRDRVLELALSGQHPDSLRSLLGRHRFLVEHAVFDVAASGLASVPDLFGTTPPHFEQPVKALALQAAAIEALAERERAGGKWTFVEVLPVDREYHYGLGGEWSSHAPAELAGLVLAYSRATGELHRYEGVARKADVDAHRRGASKAAGPQARPVREAAHRVGQAARARTVWDHLASDPKLSLAVQVTGHFLRSGRQPSNVQLKVETAPKAGPVPARLAIATRWAEARPQLFALREGELVPAPAVRTETALLDALSGLDLAGLAELLAYHLCTSVAHFGARFDRADALTRHLAGVTGAERTLQERFILGTDFLNAHTTAQLIDLIGTIPLDVRPAIRHGAPKKEVVQKLLDGAASFRAAGWLPPLVAFTP